MNDENQAAAKRVKVLYVFAALPVGGAEEVLITEVAGLDKTRFDPLVCVLSEKGPVGEQIENRGFPVVALHRMKSHRFDQRIIRDLYRPDNLVSAWLAGGQLDVTGLLRAIGGL